MRVTICYGNHRTFTAIEDDLVYLRSCFQAAGHDALIAPHFTPGEWNVLIGHFAPHWADALVATHDQDGTRLILVGTDVTDGAMLVPHVATTVEPEHWFQGVDGFRKVARVADAVWCLADHQLDAYRSTCPDVPVAVLPRAFDPLTAPPPHMPPERKDVDLLVIGTLTPYRRQLVDRLARHFRVLTVERGTPTSARIDLICRARANLHLKHEPTDAFTDIGWTHFLLMQQGAVLSERVGRAEALDGFVVPLDGQHLEAQIGDYLASDRWRTQGARAHADYRAAGALGAAMAPLIDALPAG